MKAPIPFYCCLALGTLVLTADIETLQKFGINHYGKVVIFFVFVLLGVVLNFGVFKKVAEAAVNPGKALKEFGEVTAPKQVVKLQGRDSKDPEDAG